MIIGKHYMMVKIDKAAQKEKQEKINGIYIPPAYAYMKYNLQHGEIIQIGDKVKELFPYAEIGDTAFFHHTIESNYNFLLDTLPNNDEYRAVNAYDSTDVLFAIGKKDTEELIPNPDWVFINTDIKRIRRKVSSTFSAVNSDYFEEEETMQLKIKELTNQQQSLAITLQTTSSPFQFEEVEKSIVKINEEKAELTRLINQPKLYEAHILYVNQETTKEHGIIANNSIVIDKDELYPLNIMGHNFYLIRTTGIYAVYD